MILIIRLLIVILIALSKNAIATTYLDSSANNCTNGSNNYNPATRSCEGGSDKVYVDLGAFESGLEARETNYIRSGSYFRDNVNGSLYVDASKAGTSGAYTIIKAYPGEELQVIIGTATRGATYNSNPSDATGVESWNYYPNVAISVLAPYTKIDGLKVYGGLHTNGATAIQILNCDIGGGMPGQAAAVRLENFVDAYLYNNTIHHSARGSDSPANGPGIIMYNSNATIANNTFYDNYGSDIFQKDSGGTSGKATEIRNNFFKPSSIVSGSNIGILGHNQDLALSHFYIHHNVFLGKSAGFNPNIYTPTDTVLYNNTFVNCGIDLSLASGDGSKPIKYYNNVFYHTTNQIFAELYSTTYSNFITTADYNVYYNNGSKWNKSAPGGLTWETTLSGWKTRIGLDTASIVADPNFIGSGTSVANYKRASYTENFTSSNYGVFAGAYITGNEVIGFNVSSSQSQKKPSSTNSKLNLVGGKVATF